MDFGNAIEYLKRGDKLSRNGWNGKGMYIYLVPGGDFITSREPLLTHLGAGTMATYRSHVDMKTADGSLVPWVCSQTDMLAEDWETV